MYTRGFVGNKVSEHKVSEQLMSSSPVYPTALSGHCKETLSLCSDGLIKAVGPADVIREQYPEASFDKVIDATGMCVLPGECQSRCLANLTPVQQTFMSNQ